MADTTEEKKHAPSGQKLNQLRSREGQVPRSKDFSASISLAVTVFYVILNFGKFKQQIASVFDIYEFIFTSGDDISSIGIFLSAMQIALLIIMPVFLIACLTVMLASILQTKGLILSFKSLSPNFSKLNPAEGFKKMFGMQGISESIKLIIKIIILSIISYIIIRWGLNALFWSPTCEEECVIKASLYIIIAIIIAALIIYLLVGVVDIWISKVLFMKQNKMTDTEVKKESKESFGSPEIRKQRNQQRREDSQNPSVRGFGKATVIIHSGEGLVGMAYEPGKYDIPIVVGKQYGEEAKKTLLEVRGKKIPEIPNEEFLSQLMKYTKVGQPLPQSLIMDTAKHFINYGVIKR